jgi:TPR repeat protein
VQSYKAVSHLTHKSDESRLPDDELNPLLNPLLAANMGRWAEVYCTTPPERREEAVTELIRELQAAAKPVNPAGRERVEMPQPFQPTLRIPVPSPSAPTNSDVACAACGQLNAAGQRFCGMCGSPLEQLEPKHVSEIDLAASSLPSSGYGRGRLFYGDVSEALDDIEQNVAPAEEPYNGFEFGSANAENDLPSFAREAAPGSYRHRLYIGTLVAIVLAALIYFARYRTDVFSGNQESPAARAIPAAQSAAETPEETESKPAAIENAKKSEPARSATQNSAQSASAPRPQAETAVSATQAQSASANTRTPAAAAPTSGAEELAEAEKYLSGTSRDGGEAAQWLWKAVAKGNGPGTVELADLYLRGDGVAKNCDQGRLLLDLAAKKGIKGAAVQLRNLQAFGCQ